MSMHASRCGSFTQSSPSILRVLPRSNHKHATPLASIGISLLHIASVFPRSQTSTTRTRPSNAAPWKCSVGSGQFDSSRSRSYGPGSAHHPHSDSRRSHRVDQTSLCLSARHRSGKDVLASSLSGRRQAAQFSTITTSSSSAIIALGSNVGDRIRNIEAACQAIDDDDSMRIVKTSHLYETEPMYVEDQDLFLNGVCEIETSLRPLKLLDRLQAIEKSLGRVKLIDKGPRNIDLDILTYDDEMYSDSRLTVPHALMLEREFVLRPLCDIVPAEQTHPDSGVSYFHQLDSLSKYSNASPAMHPAAALSTTQDIITPRTTSRPALVMSILNVTPDSFSDGGLHNPNDTTSLRNTLLSHISHGATIIDIGGQSSRPGAADVTAEEELARILPAIHAIKSLPEADHIAISIDTYRAAVAAAAIEAGAHIINDISGGLLDPDMLPTVAQLGCTYIIGHTRGTPATMQNAENLVYEPDLITAVAAELSERVDAAMAAGVRRWRIVLDPGFGFAKTTEQNVELLARFEDLRNARVEGGSLAGFPWLVGTSRKRFIGDLTGEKDAKGRIGGTAATMYRLVDAGADMVRVHDVREMVGVVRMAHAIKSRKRQI